MIAGYQYTLVQSLLTLSKALLLALQSLSLSSLITLLQTVGFSTFHCVLRLPNSNTLCFPFLRRHTFLNLS